MHELSIAQNMVEIIQRSVGEERLPLVRSVAVTVGAFSGVVAESLEFSFQAITDKTPLQQSFLAIEKIPFVVLCLDCKKESTNEDGVVLCVLCGSLNTRIISGTELEIKKIELADTFEEKV